jgi:hypothetical protein
VDLTGKRRGPLSGPNKDSQLGSVVYWGIYLNDSQISYTSTRELAEQTKIWMEKWLEIEIKEGRSLLN